MKKPKTPRVICKASQNQECAFGNADGTCDKLFEFRKRCFQGLKADKRQKVLGDS